MYLTAAVLGFILGVVVSIFVEAWVCRRAVQAEENEQRRYYSDKLNGAN